MGKKGSRYLGNNQYLDLKLGGRSVKKTKEREKNMVVYTTLMYYIMYKHKLPTF